MDSAYISTLQVNFRISWTRRLLHFCSKLAELMVITCFLKGLVQIYISHVSDILFLVRMKTIVINEVYLCFKALGTTTHSSKT